jgi:NADH-quinone oxidoreductase subunit L
VIGGATALFAAICAIGQTDLKRVLAFSTVSQLGFMFLACGVGAFYSAMFHLTSHAFIKALLFLTAGNVVHMMHDVTDMGKMGGLSKKFPYTQALFLIGVLAMSGIPPLAAFFSKDLILEVEAKAGFLPLFYIALLASILTAFYLTRAYCLTFLGSPRTDPLSFEKTKEAPSVMLIPVSILCALSVVGGFLGASLGQVPLMETFLEAIGITDVEKEAITHFSLTKEVVMALGGSVLGIALGFILYSRTGDRFLQALPVLKKAFFVDEIHEALFVSSLKRLSHFMSFFIEPFITETSIQSAVEATQGTARALQTMQSGQVRSYAAWLVIGSVFLMFYLVF